MRIGIVAQTYGDILGTKKDYLTFVEEFGTPVVIFPQDTKEIANLKIEGLLLPGGSDLDSKRYSPLPYLVTNRLCYAPDSYMEYFDTKILPNVVDKLPIFGICRGLQTLNVHFGGTLQMHLRYHPQNIKKDDLPHWVRTSNISRYFVNSFHHQGIKKLAPNLQALAESYDGLIEAIRHMSLPIFAVQWHPERFKDDWTRDIVKRFLFS